jgi:TATA-box binding protein (TBP) (component of TFIID and TFIIIB)
MEVYDFGKGPCNIKNIISRFSITKEAVKFNKICYAFHKKSDVLYEKTMFSLIKRNTSNNYAGTKNITIGLKYSTGPLVKFLIFKTGKVVQSGHKSDEYGRLIAMKLCVFITYHTWMDCIISNYHIVNIVVTVNLNKTIDLSKIKDRYGDKAAIESEEFDRPVLILRDINNDSSRLMIHDNGVGIICGINNINDIEENYHLMHEIASLYHN